jgi:hypothetical protein
MSDVFTGVLLIPLYPTGSCPHIDESFNCHLNDRPDSLREAPVATQRMQNPKVRKV